MSGASLNKPLTCVDRETGFLKATCLTEGARERWKERAASGLTDKQLAAALATEIGTCGGSCGPNALWIWYQAAGLKIWISWEIESHWTTRPVFSGQSTIAMARLVYGIKDQSKIQYQLF